MHLLSDKVSMSRVKLLQIPRSHQSRFHSSITSNIDLIAMFSPNSGFSMQSRFPVSSTRRLLRCDFLRIVSSSDGP